MNEERKRRAGLATALAVLSICLACGAGDSRGEGDPVEAPGEEDGQDGALAVEDVAQEAESLEIDLALLPDGVTAEMVKEGQDLFRGGGICYTCHMEDGQGGPLAPDLTDSQWLNVDGEYESIVELVETGVAQPIEHPGAMLPRAGMGLTDEQVAAVAAYAYMLSRL